MGILVLTSLMRLDEMGWLDEWASLAEIHWQLGVCGEFGSYNVRQLRYIHQINNKGHRASR